jgi:hypothetical protein
MFVWVWLGGCRGKWCWGKGGAWVGMLRTDKGGTEKLGDGH